jgi:hypothetical protein
MMRQAEEHYHMAASWKEFLEGSRDPRGDLSPDIKHLPHRAGHLLDRCRRTGAPVVTKNKPWSLLQKLQALKRGPRASAINHVDFLRDEFVNMT